MFRFKKYPDLPDRKDFFKFDPHITITYEITTMDANLQVHLWRLRWWRDTKTKNILWQGKVVQRANLARNGMEAEISRKKCCSDVSTAIPVSFGGGGGEHCGGSIAWHWVTHHDKKSLHKGQSVSLLNWPLNSSYLRYTLHFSTSILLYRVNIITFSLFNCEIGNS